MAKLILLSLLLVASVGLAKMDDTSAGGYVQNQLSSAANTIQDAGQQAYQNYRPQQGGLFSGLLGGGQDSGPFETIRQLPARGFHMLNQVFNGVRNMLPLGLGRNSQNTIRNQASSLNQMNPIENSDRYQQNLPNNPLSDLTSNLLGGQNRNGVSNDLRLPNIQQLTNPLTESLQQGRLPDVNQLSRTATNTLNGVTSNLMNVPSSLGQTASGLLGNQQGGLGGLLGNNPTNGY